MPNRILLVDDSALQATTRRLILERAGYQVEVILSAKEAVSRLQSNAWDSRFALIMTDHIMPEMTGSEFVAQLRNMRLSTPILVLSGLAEAELEYADLDVQFCLKPVPPEELISTVARMLGNNTQFDSLTA